MMELAKQREFKHAINSNNKTAYELLKGLSSYNPS